MKKQNRRTRKPGKVIQGPVRNTKKKPPGKKRTKLIKPGRKVKPPQYTHGLIIPFYCYASVVEWIAFCHELGSLAWLGDLIDYCKQNNYHFDYELYKWSEVHAAVDNTLVKSGNRTMPTTILYGLRYASKCDGSNDFLLLKKMN
ncbi:MAG: hypothetical protein ACPGO5_00420 [Patescibacteria group bacterium]